MLEGDELRDYLCREVETMYVFCDISCPRVGES